MMLKILIAIGRLPKPVLYAIASVLYALLAHVLRYRKKTIQKNLSLAFPEKSHQERQDLMLAYYRHLSEVIVETLMLASMDPATLDRHVTLLGQEHFHRHVDNHQSFLIMAAHQANWEWMFASISHHCPCPMDALYRPVHHPVIDAFFRHIRTRFGSNMLPANNAPKAILRQRKSTRAFGMIADQTPRRQDPKCWVNFMGLPTAVVTGPDRIAQMTTYPIVFITCQRIAKGQYRCEIKPLAEGPYEQPDQVAKRYMEAVEAQIRLQPAFWLWSHRRWRFPGPEA